MKDIFNLRIKKA